MTHEPETLLKPSDVTSLWIIDANAIHNIEREARKLQAQEMAKLSKLVWRSLVKFFKSSTTTETSGTLSSGEFSKRNPAIS